MFKPIIEFFTLQADRPVPETRGISIRQRFAGQQVTILGVSRGATGLKTVRITLGKNGQASFEDLAHHPIREPAGESKVIRQLLERYETDLVIGLLGRGYSLQVTDKMPTPRPSDIEVQHMMLETPAKLLPASIPHEKDHLFVPLYHPSLRTAIYFLIGVQEIRDFETLLRNCKARIVLLTCGGFAVARHLTDLHPELMQSDGNLVIIDQTSPLLIKISNRNWVSPSAVYYTNYEQAALKLAERLRDAKYRGPVTLINTTEFNFADHLRKHVPGMITPKGEEAVAQPFEAEQPHFDFLAALHLKAADKLLMPDIQLSPPKVRPFLPASYRVMPLFGLTVLLAGLLACGYFMIQASRYKREYAQLDAQVNKRNAESIALREKKNGLQTQYQQAVRYRYWLETSRPFSALMAEYFSALPQELHISSFVVRRDDGNNFVTFEVTVHGERSDINREFLRFQNFLSGHGYEPSDPKDEPGNAAGSYRFICRMRSPVSQINSN